MCLPLCSVHCRYRKGPYVGTQRSRDPDFEFLKAAKPRNFSKLAILLWDPKLGLDRWFIVKNLAEPSGTGLIGREQIHGG